MIRRIFSGISFLMLALINSQALNIVLDYTYDENYFAENPVAKATLIQAATDLSNALNASLAAITTDEIIVTTSTFRATLDWDITFTNPSDLTTEVTRPRFQYSEGTFTIYAGAVPLIDGEHTLGAAAPVGVAYTLSVSGNGTEAQSAVAVQNVAALSNTIMLRATGPTISSVMDSISIGATKVDYTLHIGALAGFLTFNKGSPWHFDGSTAVPADKYDFYTVVLHEMMHSLGFGTSESWVSKVSGANWTGQNVIDLMITGRGLINEFYNAGTTQEKLDGSHIVDGTMSTTVDSNFPQEAVMTVNLGQGERRKLTHLDVAFLLDIGLVPIRVSPPSPTPKAEAPRPPFFAGKSKVKTTLSKIRLRGTLDSPGAYVQYKVGNGKLIRAKGGAVWNFTVKLKLGKNIIYIASYNPVTAKTSALKKITIKRI